MSCQRTNADQVQQALGANYDSSRPLAIFIRMAEKIIDQVETCADRKGVTIDTETKDLLATLMACHFYQSSDPGYTSRSTSGASGSFKGQWGKRFELTDYGQNAMAMDPSGCLSAMNTPGARVGAFWGGKPDSERLSWDERNS